NTFQQVAMGKISSALVLLMMVMSCMADTEERAQIVALKTILNNLVVKGKDITVQYDLYNVGSKAAQNLQLEEEGFPSDYFELKAGLLRARWASLPAGANVSHSVVLTPLQSVMFNVSQATVRYRASEDSRGFTVGQTSGFGEVVIYDTAAYDRQFSAHATEWLTFGLMSLPSIAIPMALWYKSHRKYAALATRKLD
uniref:Translocon-associated protein subunit beta n=2 Tax=Macrostomum lignano TaxID=282301 RepID=A0A1I8F2I8_9PLAT